MLLIQSIAFNVSADNKFLEPNKENCNKIQTVESKYKEAVANELSISIRSIEVMRTEHDGNCWIVLHTIEKGLFNYSIGYILETPNGKVFATTPLTRWVLVL